ncbi:PREDICTED: vesicle-associated protein 1-2-like [Lupinus angustifolius]|uniref:vesicle-associated protein 1-2-like n=1 Tax=Lupinus angustifolius TaxID=3871 RepID=UPI00092FBA18|nr:PREDICTED: vesicle-associated protein 1-2-like [Lupinus angustifolius]
MKHIEKLEKPKRKPTPVTSLLCSHLILSSNSLSLNSIVQNEMNTGELLSIEPLELNFPFELKKQISCSLQLSNKTDSYVAFKVKTTNPKKYCVRPNTGIVMPRSTCDVMVTMQAQKEAPPDMQCKDKFLLQSVKTNDGASPKDISADMFNKEAGHVVEECKLRVVYVSPPQPPSPVPEGSEEGSSPRGSISENGILNGSDFTEVARGFTERPEALEKSAEARAHISRLTEEKNNAIQQNSKLRQELELLKREGSKNRGGVSFVFIILIGLLGIIMGYLLKKT